MKQIIPGRLLTVAFLLAAFSAGTACRCFPDKPAAPQPLNGTWALIADEGKAPPSKVPPKLPAGAAKAFLVLRQNEKTLSGTYHSLHRFDIPLTSLSSLNQHLSFKFHKFNEMKVDAIFTGNFQPTSSRQVWKGSISKQDVVGTSTPEVHGYMMVRQ